MASENEPAESMIIGSLAALGISGPSALHAAVAASVTKVNCHANGQPYDQPDPCGKREIRHEVTRDQNSQNRHERNHGSSEGALKIGVSTADDPHARTDNHERQQSSNVDHIA